MNERQGITLYILPSLPLAVTFLFPLPLPFTLLHPLPGFHAFSLIQHSHPSLCSGSCCLLYKLSPFLNHLLSTALYHTVWWERVCPECDGVCRSLPVVTASVRLDELKSPSPAFPVFPVSLCPVYRMVGSSLPFKKKKKTG